jgi:hypothetical protein
MSETNALRRLSLIALVALASVLPTAATEVTSFRWQGEDLLIRFSDSIPYRVDLAESDTSQIVIRLTGATLPTGSETGSSLAGISGRKAILTQSTPQELRLTITSGDRMGYGTIWRPYSHTLVVHTFRWRQLGYGEEQYFKALLAFEEKLDPQGIELLRIAYATGERRAASALGVYYARRGEYALAQQYLKSPVDADDHAALAAVDLKNGDSVRSAAHQHSFEQLLAEAPPQQTGDATAGSPNDESPSPSSPQSSNTNTPTSMQQWLSRENWPFIAVGAALIILLIYVVVRTMRRRPVEQVAATDTSSRAERDVPQEPTPVLVVPDPVVVEPVVPEPVVAEPIVVEPVAAVATTPEIIEPVAVAPVVAEPVVAEPVVAEPVAAVATTPEIIEPVAVAPVAAAPVTAEPIAPAPIAAEPIEAAAEAPSLEPTQQSSSSDQPVARSTSTLSTQAAELRRRIEAMRSESRTTEPVEQGATADESIVSEARRLRLSRDSVELRKRLERSGS